MILVTGATGNLGTAVIEQLLKTVKPEQIIALARDQEKAEKWTERGVEVRIGNYKDKPSLEQAFVGVKKLLLISGLDEGILEQHQNVVNTAKDAGVSHIFYTSGVLNATVDESKLGPLYDSYRPTEDYIKDSGLTYTIFQNGLYLETIPFFIGEQLPTHGISFPSGLGKASFAKREEMGEAIANVISKDGYENEVIMLTGSESYSFGEIAKMLTELSGTEITFTSPDPAQFESKLREYGVNEQDIWYASLLAQVIENNEYSDTDEKMKELIGRHPVDLKGFLKETYFK